MAEGLGPDSIWIPAKYPCILEAIIWELKDKGNYIETLWNL